MADKSHADHQHGSMDIRTQEKTFHGFVRLVSWAVFIIFLILVFMALADA
ncbi:MAG: aa3-type cytochrome c oxidase subunit IV [Paracoccaceae bacterium]